MEKFDQTQKVGAEWTADTLEAWEGRRVEDGRAVTELPSTSVNGDAGTNRDNGPQSIQQSRNKVVDESPKKQALRVLRNVLIDIGEP